MNRLLLPTGMVMLLSATLLLTNTFNTAIAYGCSNSSGTNQTNSSSDMNSNLTKPDAFVGSGHIIAICSGMSHFSQSESSGPQG